MSLGMATLRKKMPKKRRELVWRNLENCCCWNFCSSRLVNLRVTTKTAGRTTRKLV